MVGPGRHLRSPYNNQSAHLERKSRPVLKELIFPEYKLRFWGPSEFSKNNTTRAQLFRNLNITKTILLSLLTRKKHSQSFRRSSCAVPLPLSKIIIFACFIIDIAYNHDLKSSSSYRQWWVWRIETARMRWHSLRFSEHGQPGKFKQSNPWCRHTIGICFRWPFNGNLIM